MTSYALCGCSCIAGADAVRRLHVAEALIYRRVAPGGSAVGSSAFTA